MIGNAEVYGYSSCSDTLILKNKDSGADTIILHVTPTLCSNVEVSILEHFHLNYIHTVPNLWFHLVIFQLYDGGKAICVQ